MARPGLFQVVGRSLGLTDTLRASAQTFAEGLDDELFMTEEEFLRLIRKNEVQQLLCDMDVNVEPREGIFAAFSTEEDGTVSMSEIVSGLMRLRGDLSKVDMAITQSELENLQRQITKLTQHVEKTGC